MKISLNYIVVVLVLTLTSIKCKDEPTQPPPEDKPTNCTYPAGNRNFTWRLDTIAWFPSTVGGVWAFSDNDAYVIGTIVDDKPPYSSRIGRHWNGTVWEDNINGTWGYDEITGTWRDISIIPRNDVTGDDHFMVAVGYGAPTGIITAGIAEFDNTTKKWKSYQLQAIGELRSIWTDGKGYFIAVGDNGMVYTKDGYTVEWVYQKAPTDFSLTKITGVSKSEIYLLGRKNLPYSVTYIQIWKLNAPTWCKLFDSQDTTQQSISMTKDDYSTDLATFRCDVTDSLQFYVIGDQSYIFQSVGQQLSFLKINLTLRGLPLKTNGRTALDIIAYSPSDIWIFGTRYNFYHWNGSDFQKIVIPGLPNDDMHYGDQQRMAKTRTGKLFLPTEVSSQVYVVAQGTP